MYYIAFVTFCPSFCPSRHPHKIAVSFSNYYNVHKQPLKLFLLWYLRNWRHDILIHELSNYFKLLGIKIKKFTNKLTLVAYNYAEDGYMLHNSKLSIIYFTYSYSSCRKRYYMRRYNVSACTKNCSNYCMWRDMYVLKIYCYNLLHIDFILVLIVVFRGRQDVFNLHSIFQSIELLNIRALIQDHVV